MGKRGRPRHPDVLTPREWEVLALVREGLSNDDIAARLGISLDGVKYHVSEILGKLDLENRADAARWQPEARRWWALAPLGVLRPRWLLAPLATAIALAVAIGIGVLVWALLATNGGDGASGGAVPVALPASDKLAYIGADRDLWLLEGDGPARRLTNNGTAAAPAWSPDSSRILYLETNPAPSRWMIYDIASGDLTEVDVDEGGAVGFGDAKWSPDGERVAFLSSVGGHSGLSGGLFIADLDGVGRELVPQEFAVGDFAWSPDGSQLAVGRSLGVNYPEGAPAEIPEENGVYVISTDGGTPRPIALREEIQRAYEEGEAREGIEPFLSGLGVVAASHLQWSPDGADLAFQASVLSSSASNDGEALFTVAAARGEPIYHGTMLRSQALMDWFPNSHRFVFTLGGGRDVYWDKTLALAEAGVAGATEIAAGTERAGAFPSVSPDGERIVFQASESSTAVQPSLDVGKIEGPNEGIWIADADGANPRQLTSDPGYLDFAPRWSADGELVLFVRTDGKQFGSEPTPEGAASAELWMMRADGSGARPIVTDATRLGSYYGLFAWESVIAWWQGGE